MFAFFNLGAMEIVVLGGIFLVLVVPAVVLAVVLTFVLRRKRPIEPDDGGPTPLERAKNAAAVLTPEEREALRRSLERQQPPPSGEQGITS